MTDLALERACGVVRDSLREAGLKPVVQAFFDEATFTVTYVVHDGARAVVIDSVLDFDPASGRTSTRSADAVADYVSAQGIALDWILETHAHADHLSAAAYLQERCGGLIAIGRDILAVQHTFGAIFDEGTDFARDGSQFDRLFDDGDSFSVGACEAVALHVPGHTPVDVAFVIGDAVFVGDTMFMPDYGTARCDFPGGDARLLYRSIRRLMALPDETRVFVCHDYKAPNRSTFAWETTIGVAHGSNVHVHDGVSEEEFVAMRTQRDATLSVPKLILPSIQVNMRGGRLPEPGDDGKRYLKVPLDSF